MQEARHSLHDDRRARHRHRPRRRMRPAPRRRRVHQRPGRSSIRATCGSCPWSTPVLQWTPPRTLSVRASFWNRHRPAPAPPEKARKWWLAGFRRSARDAAPASQDTALSSAAQPRPSSSPSPPQIQRPLLQAECFETCRERPMNGMPASGDGVSPTKDRSSLRRMGQRSPSEIAGMGGSPLARGGSGRPVWMLVRECVIPLSGLRRNAFESRRERSLCKRNGQNVTLYCLCRL